jgi:hypothetical protein
MKRWVDIDHPAVSYRDLRSQLLECCQSWNGLAGKAGVYFANPRYATDGEGTLHLTSRLAIENKTRQTIAGYVLTIVVKGKDGKIIFTSRESFPRSSERISILPGAYIQDDLRILKFVGSGSKGSMTTDPGIAVMTTEMYVESITWEDGAMIQ